LENWQICPYWMQCEVELTKRTFSCESISGYHKRKGFLECKTFKKYRKEEYPEETEEEFNKIVVDKLEKLIDINIKLGLI